MGLCFSMPENRNYNLIGELQCSNIEEVVLDHHQRHRYLDVELSGTIKKDPDLHRSVIEYLRIADEVVDVFDILKKCLDEAYQGEEILSESKNYFSLEKYAQAANELRNFMSFEDPFGTMTESITKLHSACEEIESTLAKLPDKYGDKIESRRVWRSLGIAVFAAMLVGALICTVVLPALSVPATAVTIVGAATGALGGLWPILTKVWPNKEGEFLSVEEAIKMMTDQSLVTKNELTHIKTLVENLQAQIKSVKSTCEEISIKEEEVQMLEELMKVIRTKLVAFKRSLKDLEKRVDGCTQQIKEKGKQISSKITSDNHIKLSRHKRLIKSCSCSRSQEES